MKQEYKSMCDDAHLKEEEEQWARILGAGSEYAGMILLHDQKLCALAHEFKLAIGSGCIKAEDIKFYAGRIKNRIDYVVRLIDNSGHDFMARDTFIGLSNDFGVLKDEVNSPNDLEKLLDKVHSASHQLCDELYGALI